MIETMTMEITSQLKSLTTAFSTNAPPLDLPLPPDADTVTRYNPLAETGNSHQGSTRWNYHNESQKRRFDLIKNAPKFSGDDDSDVMIFLRGMKEYFSSNQVVEDREKYDVLRWILEGKA